MQSQADAATHVRNIKVHPEDSSPSLSLCKFRLCANKQLREESLCRESAQQKLAGAVQIILFPRPSQFSHACFLPKIVRKHGTRARFQGYVLQDPPPPVHPHRLEETREGVKFSLSCTLGGGTRRGVIYGYEVRKIILFVSSFERCAQAEALIVASCKRRHGEIKMKQS